MKHIRKHKSLDVLKGNSNSQSIQKCYEAVWIWVPKPTLKFTIFIAILTKMKLRCLEEDGSVPIVLIIQLSSLLLPQLLGIKTLLHQLGWKTTPSEPCLKSRMHAISCHLYSYAKTHSWGDTLKFSIAQR